MTRNSRHWAIAAAAFLAAAPALAGCGAGFDAITNQPYAPTEALSTKINDNGRNLSISQAYFLGPDSGGTLPAGQSTPLYLYVVNHGKEDDQLVGLGVDPGVGTAKVPAPVPLPVNKAATVGRPTPSIMIEQLKKPLKGGESVKVQLQFAKAGIVTLDVPVITRSREFTGLPAVPGASAAPTPTPTPTVDHEGEGGH
ncbi:copper chaperone PCu(A)C [Planomonospora venezuelensis]|uniref:Copper(I)-binding protein n=1 Tax=Planomonospora venezuelensis TaxID=1999 RepID=A0A841DF68_PLAVE|nr:copper(I)-binding protein [Planomonospora venezuelensis]GIM63672.1 hypothetical protein Pve01_81110 [Planomonospora venezuelensis]